MEQELFSILLVCGGAAFCGVIAAVLYRDSRQPFSGRCSPLIQEPALMFRFTIRDVLWLMALVGLGVGWCMDRASVLRLTRQNQDLQEEVQWQKELLRHRVQEHERFQAELRREISELNRRRETTP
jgi:hypothetical protein